MEAMRQKWTDERLDDLNVKVDDLGRRMDLRFDAVDRRFEAVDRRFDSVEARLDSMQQTMLQAALALTAAMLVGFAGLAGLIATQL